MTFRVASAPGGHKRTIRRANRCGGRRRRSLPLRFAPASDCVNSYA